MPDAPHWQVELNARSRRQLFKLDKPTARLILTALNGLVGWYRPNGRLAAREIADAYADLSVRAVQLNGVVS